MQLVKTQLKYITAKDILLILPIHFAVLLYSFLREINPISLICFFLYSQYAAIVILNSSNESRDYMFNSIVLITKEIALSRIILSFLGFITVYFVASLSFFLFFNSPSDFNGSFQELYLFGSLSLFGTFLYLIAIDYYSIVNSISSRIKFNIYAGILIGLLAFVLIIIVENSFHKSIESSNIFIIIIFTASLLLAAFSYFTYQKRKSYLGFR